MADTCSLAGSAVADGIPAGAPPEDPAGPASPNSDMDVYESSKDVQTSLMWMAGLPEVMELLDGGVAARPTGAVGDAGTPEDPEKAAGMRAWQPVMTAHLCCHDCTFALVRQCRVPWHWPRMLVMCGRRGGALCAPVHGGRMHGAAHGAATSDALARSVRTLNVEIAFPMTMKGHCRPTLRTRQLRPPARSLQRGRPRCIRLDNLKVRGV